MSPPGRPKGEYRSAKHEGTPMNDRFENINLLRAFAATAVLVYHVITQMKWTAFPDSGPLVTYRLGREVCNGVPGPWQQVTIADDNWAIQNLYVQVKRTVPRPNLSALCSGATQRSSPQK